MFDNAEDFICSCAKYVLYLSAFFYISDQFHSLECDDAAQRSRISENEASIENLEKKALELEKSLIKIKHQVQS